MVMQYRPTMRLQGACCAAMDRSEYGRQVHALAAYALPEVPRDPYDIPVGLAQRLLRMEPTRLTAAERATYSAAMTMTAEKGPCCCQCWRWHAFKGLANDLIARRRWSASRVAHVIDLVDGCGGRGGASQGSMMGMT
jgi:hypothetical protein